MADFDAGNPLDRTGRPYFDMWGQPTEECRLPSGFVKADDCMYLDQNDMLNMRIKSMSPHTDLKCLDLVLRVCVKWLCKPGVGSESPKSGVESYGPDAPIREV